MERAACGAWAASVTVEHAVESSHLRRRRDIEACEENGVLWLRGPSLDEETLRDLRKVPGLAVHEVHADGKLLQLGRRLPGGALPGGPWVRIDRWIQLAPQPALLPGSASGILGQVKLTLVRSAAELEASVLLTEVDAWAQWASGAALLRLRPLRFAASSDGRVAVRGAPLPPLKGQRFTETEGIAIPCGVAWSPPLRGSVPRELLGLAEGDLALFDPRGGHELIEASAFVPASRGAARRTLEGYRHA